MDVATDTTRRRLIPSDKNNASAPTRQPLNALPQASQGLLFLPPLNPYPSKEPFPLRGSVVLQHLHLPLVHPRLTCL
ncbi:unnamed protein product [Brassica oleracea var. botrytis]